MTRLIEFAPDAAGK